MICLEKLELTTGVSWLQSAFTRWAQAAFLKHKRIRIKEASGLDCEDVKKLN